MNLYRKALLFILFSFSLFSCYNSLAPKQFDYQSISIDPVWERLADCTGEIGKESDLASVESAVISPDGKYALSGSKRGKDIILWDILSGESLWERILNHSTYSVAFSNNNELALTGGSYNSIKVWRTKSGYLEKELPSQSKVESLVFSNDGKLLASGNVSGTISIWNGQTFQKITDLDHGSVTDSSHINFLRGDVNSLCFSGDDKYLISAGINTLIKIWDLTDYSLAKVLKGHTSSIKSVRITSDNKILASCSSRSKLDREGTNALKLWDFHSGKQLVSKYFDFGMEAVEFSPNNMFLVACGTEGRDISGPLAGYGNIYFYKILQNTHSGYSLELINKEKTFRCEYLDFNKNGNQMLSSHEDGTIRLWNVNYN